MFRPQGRNDSLQTVIISLFDLAAIVGIQVQSLEEFDWVVTILYRRGVKIKFFFGKYEGLWIIEEGWLKIFNEIRLRWNHNMFPYLLTL